MDWSLSTVIDEPLRVSNWQRVIQENNPFQRRSNVRSNVHVLDELFGERNLEEDEEEQEDDGQEEEDQDDESPIILLNGQYEHSESNTRSDTINRVPTSQFPEDTTPTFRELIREFRDQLTRTRLTNRPRIFGRDSSAVSTLSHLNSQRTHASIQINHRSRHRNTISIPNNEDLPNLISNTEDSQVNTTPSTSEASRHFNRFFPC